MRILWVKAGGLLPLDTGGKIRSYHLLTALAERHAVTLFTFYGALPDDPHPQLETVLARVVRCPLRLPAPKSLAHGWQYARTFFSSQPYALARFCRPEAAHALRRHLREHAYDVIVCDFVVAGGVIPWELPVPKVLFTHNVEAQIWERHYRWARNPFWKVACWREARAMARTERRYLQQSDHVLTVSEVDRNFFARFIDPAKITAIPTGVDADYFRPAPAGEQAHTLVFTGSMDWLPNEDAVFYFAREILPRIRREIPAVTLWVVGRRPSPRLQALAARESALRVTGAVDDIRPHVRRASVYVVPLRIGSGTRLKIFEALAMGKAVVSTSIGAEGLPVTHGENILLADESEDFARSVVALLRESGRRNALGRAARQLVERRFSWAAVAAHCEAVLFRVAGKPAPEVLEAPIRPAPADERETPQPPL